MIFSNRAQQNHNNTEHTSNGFGNMLMRFGASLIYCMCIILIAATLLLSVTLFSQSYAMKQIEQDGYIPKATEAIVLQCRYYFDSSGLMPQFLTEVVTEEAVFNSLAFNLDAVYHDEEQAHDFSKAISWLFYWIRRDFMENGLEIPPETEAELLVIEDECLNAYNGATAVPLGSLLRTWSRAFGPTTRGLFIALCGLFALACDLVLSRLSWGSAEPTRRGIYLGAGLALLFFPLILWLNGWASNLVDPTRFFASLVARYVNGILVRFMLVGLLLVVLAYVLPRIWRKTQKREMFMEEKDGAQYNETKEVDLRGGEVAE